MKFLPTIFATAILASAGLTQECPSTCAKPEGKTECCTNNAQGDLAGLILRWQAAHKTMEAMTAEQRKELHAKVSTLAGRCPIGSQMPATLTTTRDALGLIATLRAANKNEQVTGEQAKIHTISAELLANLGALAGFAGGKSCCGKSCDAESCGDSKDKTACCKDGKEEPSGCCKEAAQKEAAQKADATNNGNSTGCCATAAKTSQACPIQMASRIGAMKASLKVACAKAKELTPAACEEIQKGFVELGKTHEMVKLMPETFMALTNGVEELHRLHGKMTRPNPIEVALVDEVRTMLGTVAAAMQGAASQGAPSQGATGKCASTCDQSKNAPK